MANYLVFFLGQRRSFEPGRYVREPLEFLFMFKYEVSIYIKVKKTFSEINTKNGGKTKETRAR
jgi:hypothetical protein